jgi:RNA polymerase sigma factor (TIGR02999 family)
MATATRGWYNRHEPTFSAARADAMSEVTLILSAIERGDPQAASQLLPLVYDELRKLAADRLADQTPGQTLQPTALVHEAYLRLVVGNTQGPWEGRNHFYAACAEAMRHILVDNARRKQTVKHGGGRRRVPLEEFHRVAESPEDLLDLDAALTRLAAEQPDRARLVQLRFFAGLSTAEAAAALGVSVATAERWWAFARAWLYRELQGGGEAEE